MTTQADFMANLAVLQVLIEEGVVELYHRPHRWPGCDGMQSCDCPPPTWRVARPYQEALS